MAVDNLNYYSSGLPAGQQTDKYTSQPGCLKSKNLDIFSSSKSVKATAWSEPDSGEGDIVAIDDHGNLVLKTDGKVYDRSTGTETLLVDPATNFPSYNISYNGKKGTYAPATWGTVKDMAVKYEGDERRSFVVYTDRASYSYSKMPYVCPKDIPLGEMSNLTYKTGMNPMPSGYTFLQTSPTTSSSMLFIDFSGSHLASVPIRLLVSKNDTDYKAKITLNKIFLYKRKFYYDAQDDMMVSVSEGSEEIPVPAGELIDGISLNIPVTPGAAVRFDFKYTPYDPNIQTNKYERGGNLYVQINTDDYRITGYEEGEYNDYYSYLPLNDNRHLEEVGEYYWMPSASFQTLYSWQDERVTTTTEAKVERYEFVQYMGWANDVSMDIVAMVSWNEQIYMIGNMNGNGYIFPCDLSGGRGTPYIAYGCTFKGATNIDYLLYLVGEDRGISTLWVYNGQELVPLVGGNLESGSVDYIKSDEQYNFDGKMVEYRGNLVLTTSDGRIFEYGQTYGGKGGVFIHDLKPSEHDSLTINSLQAKGNDLIVNYTVVDTVEGTPTTTHWSTVYNDDSPIKNYNTTWEAVYPVVLGNHLLEKEESDLYASYILPDGDTHLEFWGCANHYHFWTFKTSQYLLVEDPAWTHKFGIKGANGDYYLEFVERVESPDGLDWYTFRLVGSLPLMAAGTTNTVVYLDDDGETIVDFIKFSEVNHFRKIGDVYPDTFTFEDEEYGKYTEGEFRFHNLNNKLELPKSHSLQVKVIGYGTADHTPELFALDLVANQRDRG